MEQIEGAMTRADGLAAAPRMLRVMLVDDHAILRQGLKALLEMDPAVQVVGEAGSVAEALAARTPNGATLIDHLKASRTLAEDVGRIAKAAEVKTLVLNHFVPADDKSLTDEVWSKAVRTTFDGLVIVGRDLLKIPLA